MSMTDVGDMSALTSEQRFLMHEEKAAPMDWVYGSPRDKVRHLLPFRRLVQGPDVPALAQQ